MAMRLVEPEWIQVVTNGAYAIADTPIDTAIIPLVRVGDKAAAAPAALGTLERAVDGFELKTKIAGCDTAAVDILLEVFALAAEDASKAVIPNVAAVGQMLPTNGVATFWDIRLIHALDVATGAMVRLTRNDSNTGNITVNAWLRRFRLE